MGSSSGAITFTVDNLGTSDLNLTGTPRVAISGTDAAMFVVGTQPGTPVTPSGTTHLHDHLHAASLGAKSATVTIANDDADENPYTFSLTGTGVAPEINVRQGATNLPDGTGSYAFGSLLVGQLECRDHLHGGQPRYFEPEPERDPEGGDQRDGRSDVRGRRAARYAGGACGDADVHDHVHPLEPGREDGDRDDRQRRLGREPVYLQPDGHWCRPRDQREAGSHQPPDGTGSYSFGSILVGSTSGAITFTVDNLGTSNLNLTGTPRVAISGTDAAMFVVGTQPATPVTPVGNYDLHDHVHRREPGCEDGDRDDRQRRRRREPVHIRPDWHWCRPRDQLEAGIHQSSRRHRQLSPSAASWCGSNSGAITFTVDNLGTLEPCT